MTLSYESPATFTRAFKELHGATPTSARKTGVSFKTYPAISFILTIKGVNEMNFRIEKKESFQIMGLSGYITDDEMNSERILPSLANEFVRGYPDNGYNSRLWTHYTAPFWQIVAIDFQSVDGKTKAIMGAEYKGKKPDGIDLTIQTVPAATWAVFSINSSTGKQQHDKAYTRILTEWFPASQYKRDESAPNLDIYPTNTDISARDENYSWEIWMPVLDK